MANARYSEQYADSPRPGSSAYAPPKHGHLTRPSEPCPEPECGPTQTCCDLECFQRPRYFCGHLLTDGDLSLEQRYVIEKHKLYHRSLHGHGVVCGLRLTCYPRCDGQILIDEGYAIDDCGNDLVVCEPQPFDVIGRLRDKKWIPAASPKHDEPKSYESPKHDESKPYERRYGSETPAGKSEGEKNEEDECEPEEKEDECKIRQCFYVIACYREENAEFTTPLTPGCGPSPRECEPTRIRETVCFDVVERLPKDVSPLDRLEASIKKCFALFTEGRFARALQTPAVEKALKGAAADGDRQAVHDAFCQLRGLLLLHLDRNPDLYNCAIRNDICGIPFPSDTKANSYGASVKTAFEELLRLAHQHVMSCVFGELVVPCPDKKNASCVVLGTVEVEDDHVVRVCNCPRSYVWSFASFFPVLIATLLGPRACGERDQGSRLLSPPTYPWNSHGRDYGSDEECGCENTHEPPACCAEFQFEDSAAFYRALRTNGSFASDNATKLMRAIGQIRQSVELALDPTHTEYPTERSLLNLPRDDAEKKATENSIRIGSVERAEAGFAPDPFAVLGAALRRGPTSRFSLYANDEGRIVGVAPQTVDARIEGMSNEAIEEVKAAIHEITRDIEGIKQRLEGSGGPSSPPPAPRRPQKRAPSGGEE